MNLPILTFHAIDDMRSVLSFSPTLFGEAIVRLHENGYRSITLEELVECLNRRALPERAISITFDDGYQSVYETALPILRKHNMTATVFLMIGDGHVQTDRLPALKGRPMLSWNEIREMRQTGIEFGAHTLTHPRLPHLSPEKIAQEMRESKDVIEQHIGSKVNSFAYPFGAHDTTCRALAAEHFSCACTDRLGLVHSKSDPYALERVDTYYLRSPRTLSLFFSDLFPTYLKALSIPRNIRRKISQSLMHRP